MTSETPITSSGTARPTETSPPENPDAIIVAPEGSDTNDGSSEAPLATIQEALQRTQPGESIEVASGEYQESHSPGEPLQTIHDGKPDAPITISGPDDAVLYPNESGPALWIKNSHVRLRGLTVDGLLNPENPDVASSYSRGNLIHCHPPMHSDDYLEDIVCAPAAIGNSGRPLMVFERTKYLEIGPLHVMGLAGAEWIVPDEPNRHAGEIIYLGQPPARIDRDDYPWTEIDQTRHVHVHHIDNSAGHPHSELVDAKVGTRDILIEYCTDGGGSQNTEEWPGSAIHLASYNSTVRWCDLRHGEEFGIQVDAANKRWLRERDDPAVDPEKIATGNSIYGNRVDGFGNVELVFDVTSPEDQQVICGNNFSDMYVRPPIDLEKWKGDNTSWSCSDGVPESDEIGHTGGDRPWS